MKILLLETNKTLANDIKISLEKENYKVDVVTSYDEVLDSINAGYSCFIFDINYTNANDLELLELLKIAHSNIPALIMSSNYDLANIKKAYELGCYDYIKKPFYILELVQKVKLFCNIPKQFLQFNDMYKYDFINRILYKENEEIELTKKEILFLELFCKNLHHVANYDEIIEYVWEGEDTNLINIRAMIKRLRKKIPNKTISSVKGLGYSLDKNVRLV
ncbi:MAG: response regulator transcription factor [Arcobacter sp.]|nr:response regulator transcription factor [Arcobacter sp.]